MVPMKTAALLDQLVIGRYKGEPCLCSNVLHVNMKLQSSLTEKCCHFWTLAVHMRLSHHLAAAVEVHFLEDVSAASLSVQLQNAHLQITWLYQACCLDFSPVWMCLKKVTEIEVLLVTGVVWEVQLTCQTTVCQIPCLLVAWAEQGMEMTVPGTI